MQGFGGLVLKATDISGQAPGGKRAKLAEVLPLDTPFVLQIFPVYACNFRCNYCIFSTGRDQHGFISDKIMMDFDLYKKCIDDMTRFPNKLKVLRLVGIGEPLLHKKIAGMVEYAVTKDVASIVEILTNGALLTPKMSNSLISAGLSRLVVSVQGTTREKYKEVCGTDIDLGNYVDNLKYFFNNKGKVDVYVKIVDCALDGKEDEQRFYDLFGNVCDTIAIEKAVPIHSGVNYENVLKGRDRSFTQFGLPVSDVHICPQPFFTMQINPDGKVVPCYSFEYPVVVGDANRQSVCDIWSGRRLQEFRCMMLDGTKNANDVCAVCNIIKYRLFPEDDLNKEAGRLKTFYSC